MTQAEIIKLLFERDENVLKEVSLEYGVLYRSVISKILEDVADAAECENDVLLAVWNSIPPNRPENLAAYICKVARNISVNRLKHNTRIKRSAGYVSAIEELKECIPDNLAQDYLKTEENNTIKLVINEFLRELDSQSRVLFIRRYFFMESIESIAQRYEIPKNRVSVKLFRARERLHKRLEQEGIVI